MRSFHPDSQPQGLDQRKPEDCTSSELLSCRYTVGVKIIHSHFNVGILCICFHSKLNAKVFTQHPAHVQQLIQQHMLLSCNTQIQEIILITVCFMKLVLTFTYRLPILSSRSLSSLRLKRSWFLFSCFSATVF